MPLLGNDSPINYERRLTLKNNLTDARKVVVINRLLDAHVVLALDILACLPNVTTIKSVAIPSEAMFCSTEAIMKINVPGRYRIWIGE